MDLPLIQKTSPLQILLLFRVLEKPNQVSRPGGQLNMELWQEQITGTDHNHAQFRLLGKCHKIWLVWQNS